jgi:UDP-N-acetylmuramoylalanine--D-glutamate ligase
MIPLPFLKDKTVGVFGLGKAGTSAIKALAASGANIVAWDDKSTCDYSLEIEKWPWQILSYLVLSPGIPFTHPVPHKVVTLAQKHNVPIICDIELLYLSQSHVRFVGITGTNGKSTTTALIGHIIREANIACQVGGNIGISALELSPLGADGIYVIETSSYQLDLLDKTRFNVAILLNVTPDHLDRHGDMDGYIKAKNRIFRNQTSKDVAVIGVDNPHTKKIAASNVTSARMIPISAFGKVDELGLGALPYLPGAHNKENIAAAYAACSALHIPHEKIITGIQSFKGLAHRMERVAEKNGVLFINDSKATNAEATEKALLSYDKPILWIAGGKAKEGGIEALKPLFPRIECAYLIGDAQDLFAETLDQNHVPFVRCGTLDKAVKQAYEKARTLSKATVLLSPACASFDQFKNFEERGEIFSNLVKAL